MNRRHDTTHPLRLLFGAGRFPEDQGMNWLQERGYISDNCVTVDEIHPDDVKSVLKKAGKLLFWSPPPWPNPNAITKPTTNP